MPITSLTKSGSQPVSLAEAKAHLRIDTGFTDDDTYISSLIAVATELVESETNCDLRSTTGKLVLPAFCDPITIPRCPLAGITAIKYYDGDNALQTLSNSNYTVLKPAKQFGTVSAANWYFPATYYRPDAVEVEFTSGFSSVPTIAKQAILLIVGSLYENREEETEANLRKLSVGVERLLDQLRVQ